MLALLLIFVFNIQAKQISVSNNPNKPAMFVSLQTAVDSAAIGDTILVSGSNTDYGSVTIAKANLRIIGEGYNNPYGLSTKIYQFTLSQTNASTGANNVKISGFDITYGIFLNGGFSGSTLSTGGLKGVVVERCRIMYVQFSNQTYSDYEFLNDTIRNCIIKDGYVYYTFYYTTFKYKNIQIHNNIFDNSYLYAYYSNSTSDMDSIFIKNNTFINRGYSTIFSGIYNMPIENNIFFNTRLTGASGCSFVNNLCYNSYSDSLPGLANYGIGNKNNMLPNFVNYTSGYFECSNDLSLQSSSPAKNAGIDLTDMGMTGGILPFTSPCSRPAVPVVTEITFPNGNSKPTGSTLNVQFKARVQK